jgi:hypothetical protein
LDAIEQALGAGGMTRAERHQIAEDVDAQIHEMLATRLGDRTAMLDDVQAVLGELDPPEAYAESEASTPTPPAAAPAYEGPTRVSRLAVVGAVWAPLSLIAGFLSLFEFKVTPVQPGTEPPGPAWWQILLIAVVLVPGLLAPIGATLCGVVAMGSIRGGGGRLTGRIPAVFAALFNPLAILDLLIIGLGAWLWHELEMGRSDHHAPKLILWVLITAGLVVGSNWLIIRMAWRAGADRVKTPPPPITQTTVVLGIVSIGCAAVYIAITAFTIWLASGRQVAQQEERPLTGLLTMEPMNLFYLSLLFILAGLVFGIASWRHPTGKVGAILSALLMLVSLLMM